MTHGTLARYAPITGPKVPVKVLATGRDQYGPVYVLTVTSRPTGSAYRKGERIVVGTSSEALTVR